VALLTRTPIFRRLQLDSGRANRSGQSPQPRRWSCGPSGPWHPKSSERRRSSGASFLWRSTEKSGLRWLYSREPRSSGACSYAAQRDSGRANRSGQSPQPRRWSCGPSGPWHPKSSERCSGLMLSCSLSHQRRPCRPVDRSEAGRGRSPPRGVHAFLELLGRTLDDPLSSETSLRLGRSGRRGRRGCCLVLSPTSVDRVVQSTAPKQVEVEVLREETSSECGCGAHKIPGR
jgi:hypothetical protein